MIPGDEDKYEGGVLSADVYVRALQAISYVVGVDGQILKKDALKEFMETFSGGGPHSANAIKFILHGTTSATEENLPTDGTFGDTDIKFYSELAKKAKAKSI